LFFTTVLFEGASNLAIQFMIMRLSYSIKEVTVYVICLLYVLLFVYASAAKLLDFENFQVQLGQSPLLSVFAGWLSILVPVGELVLAILLLLPRFRLPALIGSYSLMLMFTVYIYIILNYSSFVPCSCGGILEKMDWNDHIIFNLIYTLLAVIAIFLMPANTIKHLMP